MPGFISWISGLFSSDKPTTATAPESRLLNPVVSTNDSPDIDPALIDKLEERLFCWLLDCSPWRVAGWLAGWLTCWRLAGTLAGLLGWLAGCLAGWLAGRRKNLSFDVSFFHSMFLYKT